MLKEITSKDLAIGDELLKANADIAIAVIKFEIDLQLIKNRLRDAGVPSDDIASFVKERIGEHKIYF